MRLPVNQVLPFAALIGLAAAGAIAVARTPPPPPPPLNGPAADYPVVVGDPFTVSGTTYTPADRLNSDEVGHAAIGEAGGAAVSGAHKTLPLPAYVEVTSLDSGKTILVRLERRGPMSNDHVIELSPGAAAQLGLVGSARAPVRVRRVNPPEQDRALLRGGGQAPARMETPKGLLAVLNRKLEAREPLSTPSAAPPVAAAPKPAPSPKPAPKPVATPTPKPEPAPKSAPKPAVSGNLVVQAGAFSSEANAKKAAGQLGGKVSKPGKFWLTRLGPFATRTEAEAALAKARSAGYSDARIQRAD